jgi:Ca2+-binding EF-hand superfamily protein
MRASRKSKMLWVVSFDKPSGHGVGLVVDPFTARVLAVEDGGLTDQYNKRHPTRMIRHGDQIISVNDHYATKMFQPGGELYFAPHVEVKLSRNVERLRWLQGLALKNISQDDAELMLTTFEILDYDEETEKDYTGYISMEKAYVWFRSLGWVWSDEELQHVLNAAKHEKGFSAAELLRAADQHAEERYNSDRDSGKVSESFEVFDTEAGNIMRADIMKELAKCKLTSHECNTWLETLGYPNIQLSLNTKELTTRIAECLGELPKLEAMQL